MERRVLQGAHGYRWRVLLGLAALILIVIVPPVLDGTAEAARAAGGTMGSGFDICTVPSETLSLQVPLPVEQSHPARSPLQLQFLPPLPEVADHPPRTV